jgi:hypothetical protein
MKKKGKCLFFQMDQSYTQTTVLGLFYMLVKRHVKVKPELVNLQVSLMVILVRSFWKNTVIGLMGHNVFLGLISYLIKSLWVMCPNQGLNIRQSWAASSGSYRWLVIMPSFCTLQCNTFYCQTILTWAPSLTFVKVIGNTLVHKLRKNWYICLFHTWVSCGVLVYMPDYLKVSGPNKHITLWKYSFLEFTCKNSFKIVLLHLVLEYHLNSVFFLQFYLWHYATVCAINAFCVSAYTLYMQL